MASLLRLILLRAGILVRFLGSRIGLRILIGSVAVGTGNNAWSIANLWSLTHIQSIGWGVYLLSLIMVIIDIVTLIWIAKFVMRVCYHWLQSKKLLYLRITMPKNDSKLDNERRTEKDFREAIGKMDQFFRSIHEAKDLNLFHIIFKRWLWGHPYFSFELQYQEQEMQFFIICNKYYENIIQKQVTTFYPDANIEYPKDKEKIIFGTEFDKVKAPQLKDKAGNPLPFADKYNGYFVHQQKDWWFPINTYKKVEDDPLNGLANAFSKIERYEKACIQLVCHPVDDTWQKKANTIGTRLFKGKKGGGPWKVKLPIIGPILRGISLMMSIFVRGYDPTTDKLGNGAQQGGDPLVRMLQSEEETYKAIGEKAAQSGFKTTIRVMAASHTDDRVEQILNGIFVAMNIFRSNGGNRFDYRRIIPINRLNAPLIRQGFQRRLPSFLESLFFGQSNLLATEELASLFHFPDAKYNRIPTIKWMTYKMLPCPLVLPTEGPVLGANIYRGVRKEIRFNRSDRTRHCYVLGKSGSGKSVLLWNMARQDVGAGEGVGVIDPHGDLVEDIASSAPKERVKDIIFFDPADRDRPMGLNILEAKDEIEQESASLDAMEIFIKLFGNEIFGPRIQHYFRNGCLTLMADKDEGATLIDIPRLFIDDEFQKYKVAKIVNPVVRAFWENEMANTGEREKQEMIPYFTSKFGPFVTNTTMRNVIGQTKSAFNFREAMDSQKVLLINLSKGKIGAINAQLLGLIAVSKINQAAMSRADMAKEDRKDFYFYVDEFQNFATDTFASILSEARKYRLNLIMAHQYIAQLSEGGGGIQQGKDSKIRDAVFGNVGTMMSFKVGADDAEYLEKEYAPELSAQDILSMANYKAYCKLNISNTTSRPFSMQTLYDENNYNRKIEAIVKKYSRMKFGRKKEFVDAEIEARMGIDNLNAISDSAKADPTVNDALLTDNQAPNPGAETGADGGQTMSEAVKPPLGSNFDPSAIPAAAKVAPPTDPTATPAIPTSPTVSPPATTAPATPNPPVAV